MPIKLHLFRGFENKSLGITSDTELGHLYEDTNSVAILAFAAKKVGANPAWLQDSNGFLHLDLWGTPLRRAKELFPVATDEDLAADMEGIRSGR